MTKQLSFDSDDEEEPAVKKFKFADVLFMNPSNNLSDLNSINMDVQLLNFIKKFGKFELFKKEFINNKYCILSAESFMDNVENSFFKEHDNPSFIINHFYSLISEELFEWFFNLKEEEKSSFNLFKLSFINEVKKMEYENYNLATMNMPDISDDKTVNNSVWNFIKYKTQLLQKIYPNVLFGDVIKMAIASIHDLDTYKQLNLVNCNPEAIKFVALKIDKENTLKPSNNRQKTTDLGIECNKCKDLEMQVKANEILIEELKSSNEEAKKELVKATKSVATLNSKFTSVDEDLKNAISAKDEADSNVKELNRQIEELKKQLNEYKSKL